MLTLLRRGDDPLLERLPDYHLDRGHARATRSRVAAVVRRFVADGHSWITPESLARYRDRRLEQVARETVRGELAKLSAYGAWLGCDVRVAKPPPVTRAPVAWTIDEVRRLMAEAERTKRSIYGLPGRVYWPALLSTAWDTAERIGALWAVSWPDLAPPWLTIRAETRKGRQADLRCRLRRYTVRRLAALRECGRPRPFGLGDRSTLWKSYGRLLADAGLPNDRRSKFHKIRRSAASHLEAAGGDATVLLGHADPQTTRRHYLDPAILGQRQAPDWRPWWRRILG